MEDPYWKDNEDAACALMEDDYEYECRFVPDEALMRSRTRLLKFDGLDTCASVYLNGKLLGEPCNMHRIWEYDVTDSLREGENTLNVQFHSPLRYIAEAYKKYASISGRGMSREKPRFSLKPKRPLTAEAVTAIVLPENLPEDWTGSSTGRQRSHPLMEKHTGPFWRMAKELWSSKTRSSGGRTAWETSRSMM